MLSTYTTTEKNKHRQNVLGWCKTRGLTKNILTLAGENLEDVVTWKAMRLYNIKVTSVERNNNIFKKQTIRRNKLGLENILNLYDDDIFTYISLFPTELRNYDVFNLDLCSEWTRKIEIALIDIFCAKIKVGVTLSLTFLKGREKSKDCMIAGGNKYLFSQDRELHVSNHVVRLADTFNHKLKQLNWRNSFYLGYNGSPMFTLIFRKEN